MAQNIESPFGELIEKRKERIVVSHVGEKEKKWLCLLTTMFEWARKQIMWDKDKGWISFFLYIWKGNLSITDNTVKHFVSHNFLPNLTIF